MLIACHTVLSTEARVALTHAADLSVTELWTMDRDFPGFHGSRPRTRSPALEARAGRSAPGEYRLLEVRDACAAALDRDFPQLIQDCCGRRVDRGVELRDR